MSACGSYLYGFTDSGFQPQPDLRGLAGAPVNVIRFNDVAAVVSRHPVQRLMPSRGNVEPHHRVVRHICSTSALVPAAFGHISQNDGEILSVLRGNYAEIRGELARLAHRCEMGVKMSWNVDNIFNHLVRTNRELRELRDRVFRRREPSMNEKLEVGAAFEATLTRERERLTAILLGALHAVALDVFHTPARNEKTICHMAMLIERDALPEFQAALGEAARLFDANFAMEYSGPWPPYSFVRLRLQLADRPTAA